MPDDEALVPMSVRDFQNHYGVKRPRFLEIRTKANVKPKAYTSMLSVKDLRALLRYVSADRREAEQRRAHARQMATTPVRPIKPATPPKPPVDFAAQIEEALSKLAKTRRALVELTKDHLDDDGSGRCRECNQPAPCLTQREMTRLGNDLLDEIAVWGSGGGSDSELTSTPDEERRLRQIYASRDRWLEVLVMLTKDHMNEDHRKKCGVCNVDDPCGMKAAFLRINRGIAWRVANEFYVMDDEELRAVFHRRPRYDYADDYEEWDA